MKKSDILMFFTNKAIIIAIGAFLLVGFSSIFVFDPFNLNSESRYYCDSDRKGEREKYNCYYHCFTPHIPSAAALSFSVMLISAALNFAFSSPSIVPTSSTERVN